MYINLRAERTLFLSLLFQVFYFFIVGLTKKFLFTGTVWWFCGKEIYILRISPIKFQEIWRRKKRIYRKCDKVFIARPKISFQRFLSLFGSMGLWTSEFFFLQSFSWKNFLFKASLSLVSKTFMSFSDTPSLESFLGVSFIHKLCLKKAVLSALLWCPSHLDRPFFKFLCFISLWVFLNRSHSGPSFLNVSADAYDSEEWRRYIFSVPRKNKKKITIFTWCSWWKYFYFVLFFSAFEFVCLFERRKYENVKHKRKNESVQKRKKNNV